MEATRAAGAMLIPIGSSLADLIAAAAVVHSGISLFWAEVLGLLLPRRNVAFVSILASALIAMIDLKLVAPHFFPTITALSFWPQFLDHLAWGACFGGVLQWRQR